MPVAPRRTSELLPQAYEEGLPLPDTFPDTCLAELTASSSAPGSIVLTSVLPKSEDPSPRQAHGPSGSAARLSRLASGPPKTQCIARKKSDAAPLSSSPIRWPSLPPSLSPLSLFPLSPPSLPSCYPIHFLLFLHSCSSF